MDFIGLFYRTRNIGDEIQSIAAEQHLPSIKYRIDRDKLSKVKLEKKVKIVLNGWFSHEPRKCFPISKSLEPLIISFHVSPKTKKYFNDSVIESFKKYEPIGCRDSGTESFFRKNGISAYFSGCLTLTFPKRLETPKRNKVFLVDVDDHLKKEIPDHILLDSEELSHLYNGEIKNKFEIASNLLKRYKKEATLIITTRLHCALPCIAMGIPVVFFTKPNEYRTDVAEFIGLTRYRRRSRLLPEPIIELVKFLFGIRIKNYLDRLFYRITENSDIVNWDPEPIDVSDIRKELISKLVDFIQKP